MMFEKLQDAIRECAVPYVPKTADTKISSLLAWLEEKGFTPFEYVNFVFRRKGADKVVPNFLCADTVKKEYEEFRILRKEENSLRVRLEKNRLRILLDERVDLRKILESEHETFLMLFRYLLAKAGNLSDMEALYHQGALYEKKSMPELVSMFPEFTTCMFPKEE
jgi:hypothetical protein